MEIKDEVAKEKAVREELKHYFKPEFLNRLDDIIIFNKLEKEHIKDITKIMLKSIQQKLKDKDIEIDLTDRALEYIAEAGFDPVFGARPLKRALYEVVEDSLADAILEERVKEGMKVKFDVENDEVKLNIL